MQSVDPPGAYQLQGKLLDGDDSEGRGSGCYSRLHSMHSAEGGRSVGVPGSHMSDVPYWGHELSYSSLASNDSEYTQQPWLPEGMANHCMLCKRPFHLLRWTHHCRDCGGLFCLACSTHRVESKAQMVGPRAALRLCDSCAFSPHHPKHLGCDNPLRCARCGPPADSKEFMLYVQYFLRLILCCGTADLCTCLGGGCIAALDRQAPPPLGEAVRDAMGKRRAS